ncbi:uncharacterized protein LOC118488783 [Helianthus annuus]|uniref:uncharacterized protein LOC118488783 n=1 Tax=Helianthus annuus TaxID=4232 RepID=UPI001652D1A8|nr:uncharacterized protein LOC118488783 [Helianthus annuus]
MKMMIMIPADNDVGSGAAVCGSLSVVLGVTISKNRRTWVCVSFGLDKVSGQIQPVRVLVQSIGSDLVMIRSMLGSSSGSGFGSGSTASTQQVDRSTLVNEANMFGSMIGFSTRSTGQSSQHNGSGSRLGQTESTRSYMVNSVSQLSQRQSMMVKLSQTKTRYSLNDAKVLFRYADYSYTRPSSTVTFSDYLHFILS